jgi:hypothetical protein
VRDLAAVFRTRIELRQIGVRDESKMLGGLGICGRPFCCASFLDEFQPVSIKMAKEQYLSLNPVKISGTCGRLMCCLKYEQDAYEDLMQNTPKVDAIVDTPAGRGTVVEVFLIKGQLKVRLDAQADTPPKLFDKSEVKIIPVIEGKAVFNEKIKIPVEPMIGVIGTAPENGEIPCGSPGSHGGNMDNTRIKEGSVLYLPVYAAGGLLAMGDLHAYLLSRSLKVFRRRELRPRYHSSGSCFWP